LGLGGKEEANGYPFQKRDRSRSSKKVNCSTGGKDKGKKGITKGEVGDLHKVTLKEEDKL